MIKSVNLKSLTQASRSLKRDDFDAFLKHHEINLKSEEIDDTKSLVNALCSVKNATKVFENFYIGYKIPQISKEFDLLRFGENYVINIELKSESDEDKILNQLQRNEYYLSFLGKKVYNLTFVSSLGKFFLLSTTSSLKECDEHFVFNLLSEQSTTQHEVVDNLFDPSDYLVSPFNSPEKFLRGEYFLTNQQEDVKREIMKLLQGNETERFVSLTGAAGTGKTLLIYDIARKLAENQKKSTIIHCGSLNEGQHRLTEANFDIVSIRDYIRCEFDLCDLIIVDEAQRMKLNQLEDIITKVRSSKAWCIFSYDRVQTLAKWEETQNASSKISSLSSKKSFKLSEKIRTNKEISEFIKMLFDRKRNHKFTDSGNIEIIYFDDLNDAKRYLSSLDKERWETLRFTPSQYKEEFHESYSKSSASPSHKVIGQEFDGVAVAIDRHFSYNNDGELVYRGNAYYDPTKMLFQNITRSRKRLKIVIIENTEILKRCLNILN